MEVSDALAAIALVVSVFSAWVSLKAHRETTELSERSSRLSFERERSEFLVRIDKSRKLFERAQHRINGLLDQIESQPDEVKSSLQEVIGSLASDRDHLQRCLRQAWALWGETYEIGQEGLANHKPHHLSLIEEDEAFASLALSRADESETALNRALFIANPVIG